MRLDDNLTYLHTMFEIDIPELLARAIGAAERAYRARAIYRPYPNLPRFCPGLLQPLIVSLYAVIITIKTNRGTKLDGREKPTLEIRVSQIRLYVVSTF